LRIDHLPGQCPDRFKDRPDGKTGIDAVTVLAHFEADMRGAAAFFFIEQAAAQAARSGGDLGGRYRLVDRLHSHG
jgi:hypothetical protein